ncbi:hypothetical protein [Streptomyces cinerochromogenes]|uniref:hypothetical protein n=1 Tax=Streptomyces cinerochromogenes TaxID=66422 RepID=UPI001E3AA418|nr:hypothetical protein [Streptomyces cinerochromogenes]
MPRRLLPLLAAALMGLAGCTTVSSAPAPDAAHPRQSLAPATAVRPSVLQEPLREPSGKAALVRTGHAHRNRPGPAAAPRRNPGPGRAPVSAPPRRAAAPPARHPRPERRPPARRPAPRPRPAPRKPPTDQMRALCRQADGVAAPGIVKLCHDTFG